METKEQKIKERAKQLIDALIKYNVDMNWNVADAVELLNKEIE